MSNKTLKSKRKEELRKRNLGLGIGSIDVATPEAPVNKKITFGDDFVASDYDSDENEAQKEEEGSANDSDEESDDEVELVSTKAAKKEALELRAAERKTRKEEISLSHKRKRKTKEKPVLKAPDSDSDDDEIDDDMLDEIDSERKAESKLKKMKKENDALNILRGKHTTFVSEHDDPTSAGSMSAPIDAEHNIDVVVLPEMNSEQSHGEEKRHALSLSSSLGVKPSETALLFCRGSQALHNELSRPAQKGFEVKRSRKMKYGLSKGRPLVGFGTRKRR